MGRHSVPDPEDASDETGYETGQQPYPGQQPPSSAPANPGGQSYPDAYPDVYPDDAYFADERGTPHVAEPDRARGFEFTGGQYGQDEYAADGFEADDYDEPGYGGGYPDGDYWSPDPAPGYPEARFPVADAEPPTRSFAASGPPPRPPSSGPQHGGDWEGGDWTGSHRALASGRRGVSKSVIAALVTVVVVVGGIIMWRFFGDALSNRSSIASARCVSGDVAVAVVADPSIADHIRTLADEYNETAQPVGDRCVKVGVTAAGSDQVIDGLVGEWPPGLGEPPALWIPGSSVSSARLEAAAGPESVSISRSLVSSPVMLAMRPELKNALGEQNWAALPRWQSNPNALDGVNLRGWGALRLALPLIDDADATYVAAEAVAAASAPAGAPTTAGAGAITTLMAGQPKLADTRAGTAMDALLADGSVASAPVHAVVATEQQIYQRAGSRSDAKDTLAAWQPDGPSAMADYPAVQLSTDGLSREQTTAASEFDRYLRKPEALTELVKAGFRADVDGAELPKSDVVEFGTLAPPLALGDGETRATLADAVSAPIKNPVVTVLLDQSMDTVDDGTPRVDNVTAALNARLAAMPPSAAVGLWTFDGVAGRSEVPTGPLGDPIDGQPRSAVLTANLDGQAASSGGAVSFTTLRLVYTEAVANFRQGQENSVLIITTGPHTDQSLEGAGLEAFVKDTFAPARPVAVNVIDFGADPDRATWEAVSQSTGGTYQNVASSAGPELAAAFATMIG